MIFAFGIPNPLHLATKAVKGAVGNATYNVTHAWGAVTSSADTVRHIYTTLNAPTSAAMRVFYYFVLGLTWVANHLQTLILLGLAFAITLVVWGAFTLLRSAWREVHSQVRSVVRAPSKVRRSTSRAPAASGGHQEGVLYPLGTRANAYAICAKSKAQATQALKRQNIKPSQAAYAGHCALHRTNSSFEVTL